MGCRCRKKAEAAATKSRNVEGLLTVKYLGAYQGSRNFRTPAGSVYRFGSGANSTKLVNPFDRDYFSASPDFVILEG